MSKYLYSILEKIINYLNRAYQFDLRIVTYGSTTYIRDFDYYGDRYGVMVQDENGCDCVLLTIEQFGQDYSGSCALETFLTPSERAIAKINLKIT